MVLSYVLLIRGFSAWHVFRTNSLEENSYTQVYEEGKQKGLQEGKKIGHDEGYQEGYYTAIHRNKKAYTQGSFSRENVSPNYNNYHPSRCIHCDGRGANAHPMCDGEGCFSCDNTGLETCFICKGKGYK